MQPHDNGSLNIDAALGDVARIYRSITGQELPLGNTVRAPHLANVPMRTIPAVDCWEMENELLIVVDLPGIERDSLQVRIEPGVLHVAARRERGPLEAARPAALERPMGIFERTIVLPRSITAEPLGAELVNGTLRIRLSRKEGAMVSRQVQVS